MTAKGMTAAGFALLLGLSVGVGPAVAEVCQAQIDQQLQKLSVPSEAVDSIKVERRSFGGKAASNFRYDAWVELKSCDAGQLVIKMTKYCMVMDSYTRGGCDLPAVKNY